MSDNSLDSYTAEVVAEYDSTFVNTCCTLAAAVFFIYESIITLDGEVNFFWKRRFTAPSILYLTSKYISLTYYVMVLAIYLPIFTDERSVYRQCHEEVRTEQRDNSCRTTQRTLTAVEMLQSLPWGVFAARRAYALSAGSRLWFLLVLGLSLVPLGVNLTRFFVDHLSGYNDPVYGCMNTIDVTVDEVVRGMYHYDVVISRGCLIAADIILIGITLSVIPRKTILSEISQARSLQSILVRDGATYFIVLLVLNVLHLVFTLRSIFNTGFESNIVLFTDPYVSPVLLAVSLRL
ncbi:hypothetical protein C8Q76DRAFT_792852 [Earliella scabrosa]|nr:hypothetical protein C8Q76DRAFT_792852 [Earliella scabrosa]